MSLVKPSYPIRTQNISLFTPLFVNNVIVNKLYHFFVKENIHLDLIYG